MGSAPRSRRSSTSCVLHETLGVEWLTPDLFRFGASSLLNDVLLQLRSSAPASTGRPTSSRSTDGRTSRSRGADGLPRTGRLGLRTVARGARHRLVRGALRALHRRRAGLSAVALVVHDYLPVHRGAARRGRAGGREGRRRSRWRPRGRRSTLWTQLRGRRAREVHLPDRADRFRSARASSRSPSRWTAASRSRSRATSTFRSPRRTSSTTRAGPTSSSTRSPVVGRGRSASPRRSFPGTSRS